MILNVTTNVSIRPSTSLTTIEIYNLAQPYAGKQIAMDVSPTLTVQQFADATDTALGIEPSATVHEIILFSGKQLDLNATLEESGLQDGDSVSYQFVLVV